MSSSDKSSSLDWPRSGRPRARAERLEAAASVKGSSTSKPPLEQFCEIAADLGPDGSAKVKTRKTRMNLRLGYEGQQSTDVIYPLSLILVRNSIIGDGYEHFVVRIF